MTDRTTIQLYRLTDHPRTQTTDKNNFGPTLWRFFCFLPTHGKHICKAAQANAQPKLCKRAYLANPLKITYIDTTN